MASAAKPRAEIREPAVKIRGRMGRMLRSEGFDRKPLGAKFGEARYLEGETRHVRFWEQRNRAEQREN